MRLTKTRLRQIIKEEIDFRGSGLGDELPPREDPMSDLGVALEEAIKKAQTAVGSSKDGYEKRLASKIADALESLLEDINEI